MKTLVTGGAGFIGSHLVENLVKAGHSVTVLDNLSTGRFENISHLKNNIKFIKCDISKDKNIYKYFRDIDWVFHLAALADLVPSIKKPINYFDSNVKGTIAVLEASVKMNIKKFLYSASSSCYGIPKKYPTSENAYIDPKHPYALTKRLGEELVLHWNKVYKLDIVSLRLFNVYGTRSRTSGTYGAMFGVFLKQKIKGYPYTIVGNGNQKRDFTYVTDVVKAMLKAIRIKTRHNIFNVGSGKTVSVNYIVNLLGGNHIYIKRRPGEPDITFADISRIKKSLKWKPLVTVEEGVNLLKKNIDYWKKAPLWTSSKIKTATKDWFKYL
jgi:UDP-glucose 4-epimerase